MRIPGPGTFIPDSPAAAGGGILAFLLFAAMVFTSFGKSGAGQPGTVNYVTLQSVCAPSVDKFAEVQARAREAYDAGVPTTTENLRRVVESTGSTLLQPGATVTVLRRGNSEFSVISASTEPRASECWLATSSLKMGWGEWFSWNWKEYRRAAAEKRALSNMAEHVQKRISIVPTEIVACSTGPLLIRYTGREVEKAIPVDFSRCLARGGRVLVNGPPSGLVYFHDGRTSQNVDLREAAMLFAGPVGTAVRLECSCGDSAGPASSPLPRSLVVTPPPAEVIDNGSCPFEGCQLGTWTVRELIPVYDHPGGAVLRNLGQGDAVRATVAEVRATPRRAVLTKVYKTDEEQGLIVGSVVHVLYPRGEGTVAIWHDGKIKHGSLDLDFRYDEPNESQQLQWTWWVRVRLDDGTIGWLKNPQGKLDGMDAFG